MSDEDIETLAAAYQAHLRRIPKDVGGRAAVMRDHVAQIAAFFERIKTTARFKPVSWNKQGTMTGPAADLQRTLWVLEHDMAQGVMVKIYLDWDSHYRNA